MSANGQVKAHESDLRRSWAADEPAMRVKQQVFKLQGIESEEKGSGAAETRPDVSVGE